MAMYGLAMLPLIKKLDEQAKQVWYADDATGGGKLEHPRGSWDKLNECWPAFGYFPNAVKTSLIVKESQFALAKERFRNTGVVTTRRLATPLGRFKTCSSIPNNRSSSKHE